MKNLGLITLTRADNGRPVDINPRAIQSLDSGPNGTWVLYGVDRTSKVFVRETREEIDSMAGKVGDGGK